MDMELQDKFIMMINKFNRLDTIDIEFLKDINISHSEVHFLDLMSRNPDKKVSELAVISGRTKGAISQQIKKLEKKGLITRERYNDNYKEVFVKLTAKGNEAIANHRNFDDFMLKDLYELLQSLPEDKARFINSLIESMIGIMDSTEIRMKEYLAKG